MALKLPKLKIPSADNIKAGMPDVKSIRSKIPPLAGDKKESALLEKIRAKIPLTVRRNSERYLWLIAGFFLFVAPFAIFTRFAYYAVGATGDPNIHSICFKLPLELMVAGTVPLSIGPIALSFMVAVLLIALLFGPQFCGRLCPVGAISEFVSRIVPLPDRFRMRIVNTGMTSALRYGFLAGFILVGWVSAAGVAQCSYGVDLGRYCSSAVLEYMSLGLFSTALQPNFWNTGALLTMVTWLVIGGVLMVGGRGWCLFFCPLGAVSGLAHAVGTRLGFYHIEFVPSNCRKCKNCTVSCPMWAIGRRRRVEHTLCIGCRECVNNCSFNAYQGTFGRTGDKIRVAMKGVVDRIKSVGTFAAAASAAPIALVVTGPCATTGCASCPLGGSCIITLPLLYGGAMLVRSTPGIRSRLAAWWSRLRGVELPRPSGEEG